jgi:hypothetical protein
LNKSLTGTQYRRDDARGRRRHRPDVQCNLRRRNTSGCNAPAKQCCGAHIIWGTLAARTVLTLVLALGVSTPAVLAQSSAPVELSVDLLDHWVAAMRQIGAANLDSPAPSAVQERSQPSHLDGTCRQAGFATTEQCGCTVLYVAVLMSGFERDAQGFINPAQALQHRISAALKHTDLAAADIQALARDRRKLVVLSKALPKGVPPAHLTLIDGYMHKHLTADVNLWRQLAVGMRAIETGAIGNRCTRLPALTAPAG